MRLTRILSSMRVGLRKRVKAVYATIGLLSLFKLVRLNIRSPLLSHHANEVTRSSVASFDHSFCGAALVDDYVRWHKTQLRRLKENCSNLGSIKLLVYTCRPEDICGGLGDRLSGMISAFFLAIATDRIFLIEYTEPRNLTETLLPHMIEWNMNELNNSCLEDKLRQNSSLTDVVDWIDKASTLRLFSEIHEPYGAVKPILRVKLNRYHVSLALWHSASYTTSIYVGKLYRKAECNVTTHIRASTTFKYAFDVLFSFSGSVKQRVSEIVDVLEIRDGKTSMIAPFIGVHARIGGGPWADPARHRLDQANDFVQCARSKETLLRASEDSGSNEKTAFEEISIVVFSDSDAFKIAAREINERVKVFNSSLIHVDKSTYSDSHIVAQGNIDVFADIYLLSQAQCIIGSSSSFSGIAGALQRDPTCFAYFLQCEEDRLDFFFEDEKYKLEGSDDLENTGGQ